MAITKIQTVTVGSGGAASIDFTSIPGTYTDLMLVYSVRLTSAASEGVFITFNGNTSGYSSRDLYGSGSGNGASSTNPYGFTNKLFIGSTDSTAQTSNTFGSTLVYIPNYAGSSNKSVSADNVYENNATAAGIDVLAGLWSNTSAITSISTVSNNGNFVQYSSATLYGITKGSSGGVTVS